MRYIHNSLGQTFRTLASLTIALLGPLAAYAQVGNDNPTGPTGSFNGNVTTGGNYDPYTGNATRSITDMVVAGGVGTYPLAFTRTANTRTGSADDFQFGGAGGWRHSYGWNIADSDESLSSSTLPSGYTLTYPDGRVIDFDASGHTGYGLAERLQPLTPSATHVFVLQADGGKIDFQATRRSEYRLGDGTYYWWSYQAVAIVDPYGQRTTLNYNANRSLNTIVEPAGRWIQLVYVTTPWVNSTGVQDIVIDHIQASDGRRVQYNYGQAAYSPGTWTYTYLSSVVYYPNPSVASPPTASYTYRAPNVPDGNGQYNGLPLLQSCIDPLYSGSMKEIAYAYATTNGDPMVHPVAGQLLSENHRASGQPVSTLYIPFVTWRNEIRGDGPSRHFEYGGTTVQRWTDYKGVYSYKGYDGGGFPNFFRDGNSHDTNILNNQITGAPTTVTFPSTPGDTPPNTPAGTLVSTYGNSACQDSNNQDANIPYYLCTKADEAHNLTRFWRDTSKRVIRVDYPDGGYETFSYNGFGQIATHRLTAGGTESFTYDGNGRLTSYRDAYHDPINKGGNPNRWYQYTNTLGLVSDITDGQAGSPGDAAWTTHFEYNLRGQVTTTTLPVDPNDNSRHTTVNTYNPNNDGTLVSVTDPLGHTSSRTYDDYKRPRSITSPGHNTSVTTSIFYDPAGTTDDYTHTDSNATHLVLPSGKKTVTTYDFNRRAEAVTISGADGSEAATTSYTYDDAGNRKTIKGANQQPGMSHDGTATTYNYDERNRLYSIIDALNNPTSVTYDAGGRRLSELRANGQTVTIDSYDAMNRVLQQTSSQDPTPAAVTRYTYYASGLLHTMQDPRLVSIGSSEVDVYEYDLMGRKTNLQYPANDVGIRRSEHWVYDLSGHLQTYTNRHGDVQTFSYDNFNRLSQFVWSNGSTPSQQVSYDAASRVTQVWNWDATVGFSYFDDGLLQSQTETTPDFADNIARTVSYTYDGDGNRSNLGYNAGYNVGYTYTGRNQLNTVSLAGAGTLVDYDYDLAGNRTQKSIPFNGTSTGYGPADALNRIPWLQHNFAYGQTARFDYAFDAMSRRKYELRDSSQADGFTYDSGGAVINYVRNGSLSGEQVYFGSVNREISYDANGNRSSMNDPGNGSWSQYGINYLNQYTSDGDDNVQVYGSTYDENGNLATRNGWTYTYDAQNRLKSATNGASTMQYWYDGLNRQITRRIMTSGSDVITISVWDGWHVLEEYGVGNARQRCYAYGAGTDELLGAFDGGVQAVLYYQDGRGNTSHLAGTWGGVIEHYTYDLHGGPTVDDGNQWFPTVYPDGSAYGNRFLFQGRDYVKEAGIYDYRNRFYYPEFGRFMQPDPIGYAGDPGNIYRYCGGDPVNGSDPSGLGWFQQLLSSINGFFSGNGTDSTTEQVTVVGSPVNDPHGNDRQGLTSWGGSGWINGNSPQGMLFSMNVNMLGTSHTSGSGVVPVSLSRSIDASQLGKTSAGVPSSTQGWWTNPDGTPTGSEWVWTISVLAQINGNALSGWKSLQSITINLQGQIIASSSAAGSTALYRTIFGQQDVQGRFDSLAVRGGDFPNFKYTLYGQGTIGFLAWVPSDIRAAVSFDYRFQVNLNVATGAVSLGPSFHNGFPSYTVGVNGTSIYQSNQGSIYLSPFYLGGIGSVTPGH